MTWAVCILAALVVWALWRRHAREGTGGEAPSVPEWAIASLGPAAAYELAQLEFEVIAEHRAELSGMLDSVLRRLRRVRVTSVGLVARDVVGVDFEDGSRLALSGLGAGLGVEVAVALAGSGGWLADLEVDGADAVVVIDAGGCCVELRGHDLDVVLA